MRSLLLLPVMYIYVCLMIVCMFTLYKVNNNNKQFDWLNEYHLGKKIQKKKKISTFTEYKEKLK